MYQSRKELEVTLKHTKNYAWRFIKQFFSNFWHTVKGQQILQVSICALISLGYNVHLGIIDFDKASLNWQSGIYFCITLFVLVVILSFITAPLHLDREIQEEVVVLNSKINNLKDRTANQFKSASEEIRVLPASASNPRRESVIPSLYIEETKTVKFLIYQNREIEYDTEEWDSVAFVVDFALQATGNTNNLAVSVKAKIDFKNVKNERIRLIKKGFWQNEVDEETHLTVGDVGSLTIAVLIQKKLYSYEYGINYHPITSETIPDAKLRQLYENEVLVEIELFTRQNDKMAINKKHLFSISLEPEIKFREIKAS